VTAIQLIEGIGGIADEYDLFLLDQWGVLHNGEIAHAAAVTALRELRGARKEVILISNSSRPSSRSIANLERMGIERDLYRDVVTSGELAWREMKAAADPDIRALGERCFMFSWAGDASFIDGLSYTPVARIEDADFVLLSGTGGGTVGGYEETLREALGRELPMVCLNRDFFSVSPAGELVECTGLVARRYEEMGGTVRYYGKPGREIYDACLSLVSETKRAVAIGDSLHHDIAGGEAMGIDTVFVTGGIHAFDLKIAPGETPSQDDVEMLCRKEGVVPTYAMARFSW
jgi:HAD superfamily hydrolase (TIGR01459 family)